jgi:hypothetical protein
MKNFQIRLGDQVYDILLDAAKRRRISVADVIREALEIYAIGIDYAEQGKKLFWEDPAKGEKAEVLIPGFTWKIKSQLSSETTKIPPKPSRKKMSHA